MKKKAILLINIHLSERIPEFRDHDENIIKTIEKLYFFDYYDKYLCTLFNDILVYAPKVHETLNDDSK